MADGSEDQKADEHPGRAGHERFAAAVVLDNVEAVEGYAEVYAVLMDVSMRGSTGYQFDLRGSFV